MGNYQGVRRTTRKDKLERTAKLCRNVWPDEAWKELRSQL